MVAFVLAASSARPGHPHLRRRIARSRGPSGNRDMYLAESRDGVAFTSARKLGTSSWALDACPMDGGAISFSPDGVVSAWRRQGEVFLATDRIPEQRLGAGRARRSLRGSMTDKPSSG